MLRMRGCVSDRFNAGLAVWIVALSAIIPSLDRELLGAETAIASGQHEACAHPHHDHTLCIRFGKQGWSTDSTIPLQVILPAPGEALSIIHDLPVEFRRIVRAKSRAPPPAT
jgi:hypothetical protein